MATARGVRFSRAFVEVALDASKANRQTTTLRGTLSSLGKTGLAAIGGLSAAMTGFAVVALKATRRASDFEETIGKTRAVFRHLTPEIMRFSREMRQFGLSTRQVLNLTSSLQDMAVPMGLSRERAAELSKTIVKLGTDLARAQNLSVEDAVGRLEAGIFRGESEPLSRLGIIIKEKDIKDEIARLKLHEDQVSNATKAVLRYNLAVRQSADSIGAAGREQAGFSTAVDKMRAEFDEAVTALGKELLPTMTSAVNDLTDALRKLAPAAGQIGRAGGGLLSAITNRKTVLGDIGAMHMVEERDRRMKERIQTAMKMRAGFGGLGRFVPTGGAFDITQFGMMTMSDKALSAKMFEIRKREIARQRTRAQITPPSAVDAVGELEVPAGAANTTTEFGKIPSLLSAFGPAWVAANRAKRFGRGIAFRTGAAQRDIGKLLGMGGGGLAGLLASRATAEGEQFSRGSAFAGDFVGAQTTREMMKEEMKQTALLEDMRDLMKAGVVVFQ